MNFIQLFTNALLKTAICLFFFCTNVMSAQHFQSITVADGLSQHDVSCIIQDKFGFIWIGTFDGLNRFDGYNVVNYHHQYNDESTLSGNRITSLFEDSKNRIWVGTDGAGLNYYSQSDERFYRIELPIEHRIIRNIIETKTGEIFVASLRGVFRFNQLLKTVEEVVDIPGNYGVVNNIIESNEFIYASVGKVLLKLNDDKLVLLNKFDKPIIKLSKGEQGDLWTAQEGTNKLFKISKSDKIDTVLLPENTKIQSILDEKNGSVWVSTGYEGVCLFDLKTNTIIKKIAYDSSDYKNLLNNNLKTVFVDRSDVMWFGTTAGVSYVTLSSKSFKTIPLQNHIIGLKNYHVRSLFADHSNLFVGFQGAGIYRISLQDFNQVKKVSELPLTNRNILKVKDTIFFASHKGLFKYNQKNEDFIKVKNGNFLSVCSDTSGNIYLGGYNDFFVKKANEIDYKKIHELDPKFSILKGKRIFCLNYDSLENGLWIGTVSDGLFRLNLGVGGTPKSIQQYSLEASTSNYIHNNMIWSIYQDKISGDLWVGTDSGLLFKGFNDVKFKAVNSKYLTNKKILSIQKDASGNLWLGGSQGLISFNPKNNISRLYTYYDGLKSSAFTEAAACSDNGTMFFGNIFGINYFKPAEVSLDSNIPRVLFSKLSIHNNEVSPLKEVLGSVILTKNLNQASKLVLNHRQNNFKIDFASTSYFNAKQTTYQYQLLGYDKDAITVNGEHNFASYSNLPSGLYTFSIQVANADGLWNPEKREIQVEILPAPWASNLAYFIYVVFALGILFTIIYFVFNKQRLKYQLEFNKRLLDKDREVNEMKLEYFTDIAHEFKTPLSLIIGPLNELLDDNDANDKKSLRNVLMRNGKRLSYLVNQLLDFRKINAGINILKVSCHDISSTIKDIVEVFSWEAKSKSIQLSIDVPEHYECYYDKDVLEKVLYNLLSNALRHTPNKGTIQLRLENIKKDNKLFVNIAIKDSGNGIPDDEKLKIFDRFTHGESRDSSGIGLNLTHKLLQAHKGDIIVKDSNLGGVEFLITIPVDKSLFASNEFFNKEEKSIAPTSNVFEENIKPEKPLNNEKVLVVEDDNELRAYLTQKLQKFYYVEQAENGKNGLEIVENFMPDLIVCDVMMPEMNGIDFCKSLKNIEGTSHIPVLMLTAKTDDQFKQQGLKAGAWDYISKPFDVQDLLQKISNIITTRNSHKAYLLKQNKLVWLKENYTPHDKKFVLNFTELIVDNMLINDFSIDDYAKLLGTSRMQIHRKIKELTGESTTVFINSVKMSCAKEMFDKGCDNIKEVMYAIGISDYSYFSKLFKKFNGVAPKAYLKSLN